MLKSFKTELNPNNKQKTKLSQHAGTARFVYNWGLDLLMKEFERKKKDEQAYIVSHKLNTEKEIKEYRKSVQNNYIQPSAITLHKILNQKKEFEFPWMYECSKWTMQNALYNLENSFKRYFSSIKKSDYKKKNAKHFAKELSRGKEKILPLNHPKFKKKNKKESFTLDAPVIVGNSWIKLPRIGKIRLYEKNYIPQGKPKSATISMRSGRWFVSVSYETEIPQSSWAEDVIGVDFGVKSLMVCSDKTYIEPPKKLKQKEETLKRQQRKLSRQQKNSKSREKTKQKISKLHFDISNNRKDVLHKATTLLTKTKSERVICIEDLNVKGMLKNSKISKSIANIGFYEARRQLEYKSKRYGKQLIIADRFFPSSKMVNATGEYKEDLKPSDRWIVLPDGSKICRDYNASLNLRDYGRKVIENTVRYTGINAGGDERLIVSQEARCSSRKPESNIKFTDLYKF